MMHIKFMRQNREPIDHYKCDTRRTRAEPTRDGADASPTDHRYRPRAGSRYPCNPILYFIYLRVINLHLSVLILCNKDPVGVSGKSATCTTTGSETRLPINYNFTLKYLPRTGRKETHEKLAFHWWIKTKMNN